MTIGSPARFISASFGTVTGAEVASEGSIGGRELISASNDGVVDQAGPADPGRDRDQDRAAVEGLGRRERLGVARLEVVGLDPGALELGPGGGERRRRRPARARRRLGGAE